MKVSELRTGNFLYNNEHQICEVTELREPGFIAVGDGEEYPLDHFTPIPLSSAILPALGFRESYGVKPLSFICGPLTLFREDESVYTMVSPFSVRITTVHQLQNLYYALTGGELSFDPDDTPTEEEVRLAAEVLLPFNLKNEQGGILSFEVPLQGSAYRVFYEKDAEGYWAFSRFDLLSQK